MGTRKTAKSSAGKKGGAGASKTAKSSAGKKGGAGASTTTPKGAATRAAARRAPKKQAGAGEAAADEPAVAMPVAEDPAPKKRAPASDLPEELAAELARNPAANAIFRSLSPSHQREYVSWVVEGKREPTRARRAEKAIGMLLTGRTDRG